MVRLLLLFTCLVLSLAFSACEKSGTTRDEKMAALEVAKKTANEFPDVGPAIISLEESHSKMEIVIKAGLHPQKQAEFLQTVTMAWYDAYPEGKKPTVNDMLQVWLFETDKSKDDIGFMKIYNDQHGKMKADFHHYKTQQSM